MTHTPDNSKNATRVALRRELPSHSDKAIARRSHHYREGEAGRAQLRIGRLRQHASSGGRAVETQPPAARSCTCPIAAIRNPSPRCSAERRQADHAQVQAGGDERRRSHGSAGPGELYLRPFALGVGETEGPHPITASAHDQVEPAGVRMNASLQGFNLVRIERHFNVPFSLPLTGTDALPVMVSCSARNRSDVGPSRILQRGGCAALPLFYQDRLAFGDLWQRQTIVD
ncbi:hypothetical protein FBZ94_106228 [Bradyrhizobium sacchari]|uniref:Uncharacterized protein n=1 Tax=Bradyrhizobium sacchari TaxID=1399419 RepID=A0A560JJS8_9BRAD|nr:hypothetical protein FBZ94_106228 [Bradyrhizobium sacchari]TWB71246.1 hypothetical protein FBZ95_107228 [Bradyrhizobium sacchari]